MIRPAAFALALAWATAAHAQSPVAPPSATAQPLPAKRWTVQQIREAFQLADANSDGQLSRAEAQRLPLLPKSFEDADLNKDGALTLDEYIASFSS